LLIHKEKRIWYTAPIVPKPVAPIPFAKAVTEHFAGGYAYDEKNEDYGSGLKRWS
jgi:hypothetical protein